ncbi:hypothetical protein H4R20_006519 [Coemansia guatemalensis]|uniref:gluconokinase n=1 Tax=Coemansia guatemalensis TaxID=2761395 RepID=A0A9W8HTL6_9FUNG|nr:hypothetical protein H4R20_006519 [Coemansia guatemalensis]
MRVEDTQRTYPVRTVIVMGVSGCGKTAIGSRLASMLGHACFIDADALHPSENIDKMARGIALSDSDRWPWLRRVRKQIDTEANRLLESRGAMLQPTQQSANDLDTGETDCPQLYVVCGCSALKRSYRELLSRNNPDVPAENQPYDIVFAYISVEREELARRLNQRKGHFFDPSLMDSQLSTLEPPDCTREAAIVVDGNQPVEVVAREACEGVKHYIRSRSPINLLKSSAEK